MEKIKEDEEFSKEGNPENGLENFENEFNSKKSDVKKNNEDDLVKFDAYFYFKINDEKEFIFPVKS